MMNDDVKERDALERAYTGRIVLFGELHDHSYSGGTSDGKCSLDMWKKEMPVLKMDFAAILDHRQVRHMYLDEWDDSLFVCGTEPGTSITDSGAEVPNLHYNMLFPNRGALETILSAFPEFEFTGGREGHFTYPRFTTERFGQLIDAVRAHGGFFVIPHPKQIMASQNPLDYWFRDFTGIEVFYMDLNTKETEQNYELWMQLLAKGKRVWACAGGDLHNHPGTGALTTLYARKRCIPSFFPYLRAGDFSCGNVGIRMLMGQTRMGGACSFDDQRLVLAVGDFHDSVLYENHHYHVELWNDREMVFRAPLDPLRMNYFAVDTDPSAGFYRAEVWDEDRRYRTDTVGYRIAIGNPIWRKGWKP